VQKAASSGASRSCGCAHTLNMKVCSAARRCSMNSGSNLKSVGVVGGWRWGCAGVRGFVCLCLSAVSVSVPVSVRACVCIHVCARMHPQTLPLT